jgi:hypothetical protein
MAEVVLLDCELQDWRGGPVIIRVDKERSMARIGDANWRSVQISEDMFAISFDGCGFGCGHFINRVNGNYRFTGHGTTWRGICRKSEKIF